MLGKLAAPTWHPNACFSWVTPSCFLRHGEDSRLVDGSRAYLLYKHVVQGVIRQLLRRSLGVHLLLTDQYATVEQLTDSPRSKKATSAQHTQYLAQLQTYCGIWELRSRTCSTPQLDFHDSQFLYRALE
jgi:hypothetical protein